MLLDRRDRVGRRGFGLITFRAEHRLAVRRLEAEAEFARLVLVNLERVSRHSLSSQAHSIGNRAPTGREFPFESIKSIALLKRHDMRRQRQRRRLDCSRLRLGDGTCWRYVPRRSYSSPPSRCSPASSRSGTSPTTTPI